MNLSSTAILGIVVILIALGAALFLYIQARRSKMLKAKFGPEYSRIIGESGSRARAETQLLRRQKRVEAFRVHPLPEESRKSYAGDWMRVQKEFVDNPKDALRRADDLLCEVMRARGYPITNFDQQSEDLSVHHPIVVQNYRAAHEIAQRHRKGEASTEDLRQAMIHYHKLFDELVADDGAIYSKAS